MGRNERTAGYVSDVCQNRRVYLRRRICDVADAAEEVVNGRHWATDEELMDYYAIGQCTPGIIAVNTATFVGYKNRGIPGAIAATLGVIAPSLVIIMIIAAFISNFIELAL